MAAKQISKNYIIDTNVLLRFFVGDNKEQQKQASKFFKEAESRKIKITVPSIVIAEACFVLESFYKKNRLEIADSLEILTSQRWLKVEDRKIIKKLWSYYRKNLHFVDSYLLAWQEVSHQNILTFDQEILKYGT